MHAIVTVAVDGAGGSGSASLAEILVVDCSSSMSRPPEKLRAAKEAATAALMMLPDGTPFAVVEGTQAARTLFPRQPGEAGMALAGRRAREAAAYEVSSRMHASGGTSIGAWLALCGELLAGRPEPIRHVLLLTDGRNEHDSFMPLAGVLDACEGQFTCDAWGIGDGWDARELQTVARRLHGSVSSVHDPEELPEGYRDMMARQLRRSLPKLTLRITPSPGTRLRYLKQVHPTEMELTGRPRPDHGGAVEFTTRSWGTEVRRYHLCLTADPEGRPHREDTQVAAVGVSVPRASRPGDGNGHEGAVRLPADEAFRAHWTDDPTMSPAVHGDVEHFRAYDELGRTVGEASDAFDRGDRTEVGRLLGRAVAIAHRLADRRQLAELARAVEIDDAEEGRVRPRPGLSKADFQHMITASAHSTFGPSASAPAASGGREAVMVPCRVCGAATPAGARFCPAGGHSQAAGT